LLVPFDTSSDKLQVVHSNDYSTKISLSKGKKVDKKGAKKRKKGTVLFFCSPDYGKIEPSPFF